ncbi:MAG: glycosyltransferase, partial [Anaerolineae bacterium]
AAGRPAVATAVGGVPDLVADGETGFVVPPGDPAALAERTVRLLKDEALRRRMGSAARERALARWWPPRVAEQYRALLWEVARGTEEG